MHVLLITLEPKVVEFVRAALVASGHEMTHLERADLGTVHADVLLCGPDVAVDDDCGLALDAPRVQMTSAAALAAMSLEDLPPHELIVWPCAAPELLVRLAAASRRGLRLAESRRVLDTLVSNLPGMVYRCRNDPQWTMEIVSDGSLELTGYAPAELLLNRTVSYANLIHPDDRDRVWDEVQRALDAQREFRLVYRIVTARGAEKWVWEQGRGVFSEANQLLALEGFITDISDRVRAEGKLRERELLLGTIFENSPNALLVCDSAGKVTLANAAASRIFGVQRRIEPVPLSQVVRLDGREHTLLVVREMTAALRRQEVETWKRVIIGERATHLSVFLRSYGEFARLPQPRREPVPWGKFFDGLSHVIGFRPKILASPPETPGYFDTAQLQQVFINLCKNAREAGSAPGDIALSFSSDARGVRIEVLDRGSGIPASALDRVLLPFYSTRRAGTGLGLALCREILEAHDGCIGVANRPGGGAIVTCAVGHAPTPAEHGRASRSLDPEMRS